MTQTTRRQANSDIQSGHLTYTIHTHTDDLLRSNDGPPLLYIYTYSFKSKHTQYIFSPHQPFITTKNTHIEIPILSTA